MTVVRMKEILLLTGEDAPCTTRPEPSVANDLSREGRMEKQNNEEYEI